MGLAALGHFVVNVASTYLSQSDLITKLISNSLQSPKQAQPLLRRSSRTITMSSWPAVASSLLLHTSSSRKFLPSQEWGHIY
jgi:hypothetical protein